LPAAPALWNAPTILQALPPFAKTPIASPILGSADTKLKEKFYNSNLEQ